MSVSCVGVVAIPFPMLFALESGRWAEDTFSMVLYSTRIKVQSPASPSGHLGPSDAEYNIMTAVETSLYKL